MAIERLSTDELITEILYITGYSASTAAPWLTDAALIIKINYLAQKIPQKVRIAALAQGLEGRIGIPMWWTTANSTVSAGAGNFISAASASTGLLPDDYDMPSSLWDITHERYIDIVDSANESWYSDLRLSKNAGPTQAMHIQDYSGGAQRAFRVLPDVVSGITPSMRLEYYRLPAEMTSGGASFPDADYKYHYLWILEPILEIMRPDDAAYNRYQAMEAELIQELSSTAVHA